MKQHPSSPPRPCVFSDENLYCVTIRFGKVSYEKIEDVMNRPIPSCTMYDVREIGVENTISWVVATPMTRGEVAPAFHNAMNLRLENQADEITYYGIVVRRVRAWDGFAR